MSYPSAVTYLLRPKNTPPQKVTCSVDHTPETWKVKRILFLIPCKCAFR